MKKWTLWLIVVVMVVAFVSLLVVQASYLDTVFSFRNQQFNSHVSEALSEVSNELEREEMSNILRERLDLPIPSRIGTVEPHSSSHLFTPQPQLLKQDFRYNLEQLPLNRLQRPNVVRQEDRILEVSRSILDELSNHYNDIRDVVFSLAMESLTREGFKPIYERMTGDQLDELLAYYLPKSGIEIPYVYEVVDTNNRIYFSTGKVPRNDGYSVFTQVLFPSDIPSRYHFLKVYFPGKRQLIAGNIDFLVPSIAFTVILFITFVFTIVNLFRQKKVEDMRTDFINNMTHELKTPVSSIKLGVQMLHEEGDANRSILNTVEAETERLILLIDKVLQMSFFGDEERTKIVLVPLDVEELLISVTSIFGLKIENAGGEIDLDLEAEETTVLADKMHLTNIIFNLMDNALKYKKPDTPPVLSIATINQNNNIVISIADNGIGIKKEYVKKIFERFYRVPTGDRHDVRGFGLGLAYVFRMVKAHNGDIRAESEYGVGTKFIISLPLHKE